MQLLPGPHWQRKYKKKDGIMNYLIGFDIGTQSTRCILIDRSGKLIASSTKGYDMDTPRPGWAEQNPDLWWEASIDTVKDVLKRSGINPSSVKPTS